MISIRPCHDIEQRDIVQGTESLPWVFKDNVKCPADPWTHQMWASVDAQASSTSLRPQTVPLSHISASRKGLDTFLEAMPRPLRHLMGNIIHVRATASIDPLLLGPISNVIPLHSVPPPTSGGVPVTSLPPVRLAILSITTRCPAPAMRRPNFLRKVQSPHH